MVTPYIIPIIPNVRIVAVNHCKGVTTYYTVDSHGRPGMYRV